MHFLLSHEGQIRLTIFIFLFLLLGIIEFWKPFRKASIPKKRRWTANIALTILNTVALRLCFPTAAVGIAIWAEGHGLGLFHILNLSQTVWLISVSILLLDLLIYWQHRLFHSFNFLWRWHQVHHADPDFDITTGSRFHPVEILVSMGIKICLIVSLGLPPLSVLIFEIILSSMSLFTHSNFKLSKHWESWIRRLFVTPSMHRIHHSQIPQETNANYGFNLSVWDRLFKSYCDQAQKGDDLSIGLRQWNKFSEVATIKGMLMMPFKKLRIDGY